MATDSDTETTQVANGPEAELDIQDAFLEEEQVEVDLGTSCNPTIPPGEALSSRGGCVLSGVARQADTKDQCLRPGTVAQTMGARSGRSGVEESREATARSLVTMITGPIQMGTDQAAQGMTKATSNGRAGKTAQVGLLLELEDQTKPLASKSAEGRSQC